MRILSRYFAARFLRYFVAILMASTFGIATVEMLLNFDDMLKTGGGSDGVVTYLLLRLPSYYLRELVPICTFAAAFTTLGLAARWFESTAAKTGGISPIRIILPVLMAAALVSAGTFAINETVVVDATRRWESLGDEEQGIAFRQGSFWYHSGHTIYNIKEANRAERTLRGLRVYTRNSRGRLLSTLHADHVRIEDDQTWNLEEATIYHFDPQDPTRPARIEHAKGRRQRIAERSQDALLAADSDALSIRTLLTYIAANPSPERVQRLRTELHTRLTEPFVTLVFAVIAVALGMRVEVTRNLAGPAVYGVIAIGAFYLVRSTGTTLASEGLVSAVVAPWSCVALFALAGTWGLIRVPR